MDSGKDSAFASATQSAVGRFIGRLIGDHREIETSAAAVVAYAERGDCVVALLELAELHQRMVRHDGLEESVLFPLLCRELGDVAERVRHTRGQHRSTESLRRAVEQALLEGNFVRATRDGDDLHALLVGNHTTEELVLYGVVEELLSGGHAVRRISEHEAIGARCAFS